MKRGTRSSFSAMTGCSKYGFSWRLPRSRYRERRCQCRGCRKRSAFQPLMPCARRFWRSRERRILTDAGITTLSPPPISRRGGGWVYVPLRLRPEWANCGHWATVYRAHRTDPSLPFEYWLGGGILWLAQHITSASTALVLSRMMPGGGAGGETRKIAAILVSDVVGYSRLAGADEDRTLARLRALRSDLIDPTISVHHGRIVKRTGDGSVIEFRSVVDAVRCALEVQHAMVERNAGVAPDKRIEFRIGIHLGDVVEESDGDLMGDGVNIAARLESICEPGAICLSEDAYRQVKGRLDMAVTDLGPTQLKNIAEPVRVYSLEIGVPAQAKPSEPKRRLSPAPIAIGIAALAALAAASAWYFPNANAPAGIARNAPAEAARLSIVVTPFANLSGDPGQDYLVDALTDELTTSLARIRGAFVIARNTAMTFKGKPVDAKAIGRDLGVRYVLEGSVEPSGERMRVNAQLIDAESGAHLWAEQFAPPRTDLLQTQDAIVAHLARAMDLQLIEAEGARVKRAPVANRDAEDLALQCVAGNWKAGGIGEEADAAYALCEQALAIDPNNVRALTQLGWKFFQPAQSGVSGDPKGDLARADELVSKALALDPDWTWPHVLKGNILGFQARYP